RNKSPRRAIWRCGSSSVPSGYIVTAPEEKTKKKKRPKRKKRFSVLRFIFLMIVFGGLTGTGFLLYGYREFSRDLPPTLHTLLDYRPSRASRVFDIHGE